MNTALPFRLPVPAGGGVDLLVVAAEHSGDQHAARMVRELKRGRGDLRVAALGGPALAAEAQLLEDLTANATMGFAVFGRLSFYRALIAEVVRWVGEHRPRAVCFIDSSGLNLRIAQGLFDAGFSAKAGGPTRTLYYISPQIWASRAGRRFKMARLLDGVAAIFPFEPAVYADTELPVEFVGHPFVAPDYHPPVRFDPAGPVLLLPGSRGGVVARLFPVLLAAFQEAGTGREAVVLYPDAGIAARLRECAPPANVKLLATSEVAAVGVGASAVLTASGTMSMHCALAGIPGAVAYRTDPLTYWLGRLLVKVEHIGIANLLLKEAMYPEYIQGAARSDSLAAELRDALDNPARLQRTRIQAERLRQLLAGGSSGAAEWVGRQLE